MSVGRRMRRINSPNSMLGLSRRSIVKDSRTVLRGMLRHAGPCRSIMPPRWHVTVERDEIKIASVDGGAINEAEYNHCLNV